MKLFFPPHVRCNKVMSGLYRTNPPHRLRAARRPSGEAHCGLRTDNCHDQLAPMPVVGVPHTYASVDCTLLDCSTDERTDGTVQEREGLSHVFDWIMERLLPLNCTQTLQRSMRRNITKKQLIVKHYGAHHPQTKANRIKKRPVLLACLLRQFLF